MRTRPTWEEMELRRTILIARLTPSERLANSILIKLGVPVYIQEIIYPYICDFVGVERDFILEIDGNVHTFQDIYDDRRSNYLYKHGFEVYRISNESITEEKIKEILDKSFKIDRLAMRNKIDNINNNFKIFIHF